jgi:hypothetical protein
MSSLRRAPVLALAALGLAATAAAGPCKSYRGTFTAVRPAECPSPVGICTHGTLVGGFPSTYDFVADTLIPTGSPGEFAYTGHSVITTRQGARLSGSDSGHLTIMADGTAPFVTTVHLVGGTRQYEGATGQFVASGVLTLATGATVGSYEATVCKAEDGQ